MRVKFVKKKLEIAAVSCSPNIARLAGMGLGSGTMGKLGRGWVGVWVVLDIV